MAPVSGGTDVALHGNPPVFGVGIPQVVKPAAIPPAVVKVGFAIEPPEPSVPVSAKVCEPAAAVRLKVWPLIVPVIVADPLLHTSHSGGCVPATGPATEYTACPVTTPLFCSRNPPCKPY